MAIFEALTISAFPAKARFVVKIDTKPMPPKSPAPKMWSQFESSGSRQMPMATATKLGRTMPKGLPRIKPAMMPKLLAVVRCWVQPVPRKMPVLANAKIGKITKVTAYVESVRASAKAILRHPVAEKLTGRGAPCMLTGSCGAQHTFTNRSRSRCISRSLASQVNVSFSTRAASASGGSTIR